MNKSSQFGFTLIEVIIALLILSVAFTSITISVQTNIKHERYLKEKTAALWVASNVISEAQIGTLRLNSKIRFARGQVEMFKSLWNWSAKVNSIGNNTLTINVQVSKNNVQYINLKGYLLP